MTDEEITATQVLKDEIIALTTENAKLRVENAALKEAPTKSVEEIDRSKYGKTLGV